MATDERIIFPLFLAQQRLRTHMQKVLRDQGIRVTVAQAGILFLLEKRDDRNMSDLSHAVGMDNSTLTGSVDRLEKAGFVTRKTSSRDRRRQQVRLTDLGREEAALARPVIRGVNKSIKDRFTRKEMDVLLKVLYDLIHHLKPY
ncbi:MAG: winged helix-turn-helix transcriptional regulator [Deltaproteobacteria bacterium]|nr:winged helix-turn-helix transcriptional regulator [Deltaproteobacteria bacterium]MBW1816117.1 winged helix-turn-helix transcriptional regulator [Deltaproteobacteria bacterium]